MNLPRELLLDLARQYGTPLYVYNGDLLLRRYRELYDFFPWPKLRVLYAMKANFNPALLKLLREAGAGIDAVSPGEVILAMNCGFREDQILYTANNLTEREMRVASALGVLFNIDTVSTLDRFGRIFPGSDVCLRFNPDVVAGENAKVQTAGGSTKFGILLEDLHKVKEVLQRHDLHAIGLHMHTGSGIKEQDKLLQAMHNLLAVAGAENFPELRFVDFGGGLAVPYRQDEQRIDYAALGGAMVRIFGDFCRSYGRELEMYLEPGKYIAAEAGTLLIAVNTLKRNRGKLFAGTDAGFSQFIRPVLYGAYHHILNLSNPQGAEQPYDVCGNICESGDLFAADQSLPKIREGDVLAVQNAGAYCYSMGGLYNLRSMPPEALVLEGKERLVRRRASEEELVSSILSECL